MPTALGSAHPLGNFSISHYTAIGLEADVLLLRYIIDMAEIPTFQEMQRMQIVPQEGHEGLPAYLAQRVDELRSSLILELNGIRLSGTPPLPFLIGEARMSRPTRWWRIVTRRATREQVMPSLRSLD